MSGYDKHLVVAGRSSANSSPQISKKKQGQPVTSDVESKPDHLRVYRKNGKIPRQPNDGESALTVKQDKSSPLISRREVLESRTGSPGLTKKETKLIEKSKKTPPADLSTSVYQGPKVKGKKKGNKRRFIVCRHGERVDFTFGRDWIKENFDSAGRYTRIDLNMPKSLPIRPGGPAGFVMDSPLTNIGHYQAHLTGEALKEAGVNITCIYASPALRCVQTAAAIIEGMQLNVPIRLEPGLFEWLGYYPSGLPRFLIPSEFESAGFNVDLDSPPCYTLARLQESLKENVEQYFNRCLEVSRFILQKEPRDTIVVGHASSLDTNVRGLLGKRPRPTASFMDMVRQTSYAATVSIEEVASDKWTISPILVSSSVLHQGNPPFNSKQFLLR